MQSNKTGLNSTAPTDEDSVNGKLWLGFPAVVIIWLAYGYLQSSLPKDSPVLDNPFDRLNTLFSGLAFWGVIYAILLQKSELILQRKELALTRNEVRGQKEQLEAQNATLKQQRFESTYFSLLNLFKNIVDSIEVTINTATRPETFKGRECFIHLYNDFQREYAGQRNTHPDQSLRVLCQESYERLARYRQTAVGHYFRTLYNIIKFIATSEVENKQIYINILRAQLSSSELNLLFYNCLSKYGSEKFKPFVEEFGLLENMTIQDLIDQQHTELYKESAFKSQS